MTVQKIIKAKKELDDAWERWEKTENFEQKLHFLKTVRARADSLANEVLAIL